MWGRTHLIRRNGWRGNKREKENIGDISVLCSSKLHKRTIGFGKRKNSFLKPDMLGHIETTIYIKANRNSSLRLLKGRSKGKHRQLNTLRKSHAWGLRNNLSWGYILSITLNGSRLIRNTEVKKASLQYCIGREACFMRVSPFSTCVCTFAQQYHFVHMCMDKWVYE